MSQDGNNPDDSNSENEISFVSQGDHAANTSNLQANKINDQIETFKRELSTISEVNQRNLSTDFAERIERNSAAREIYQSYELSRSIVNQVLDSFLEILDALGDSFAEYEEDDSGENIYIIRFRRLHRVVTIKLGAIYECFENAVYKYISENVNFYYSNSELIRLLCAVQKTYMDCLNETNKMIERMLMRLTDPTQHATFQMVTTLVDNQREIMRRDKYSEESIDRHIENNTS